MVYVGELEKSSYRVEGNGCFGVQAVKVRGSGQSRYRCAVGGCFATQAMKMRAEGKVCVGTSSE